MSSTNPTFRQSFFHGTKADLKLGDLIAPGCNSNYGAQARAGWVYFTSTLDAAIWGAELAAGDGRERIYIVEPTGPIVDDPNLTDKNSPAIRRCPTAPASRSASSAKLRHGRATRPSG